MVILILGSCFHFSGSMESADLVLLNGRIYSLDRDNTVFSALAVKGNRIYKLGSDRDIKKYIDEDTRVIDLQQKMVTPGFIESHGHLYYTGYALLNLDLSSAANYDELVRKVQAAAANLKPGEWIFGQGWHQDKWEPLPSDMVSGFQTHHLLSAASPDNPVYLSHASGHALFVNAKAMELAGIDENTEFDESGVIIKDEKGFPTGVFTENAGSLFAPYLPEEGLESMSIALNAALDLCAKNGITSFHDAGVNGPVLRLMETIRDKGELKVRIYAMLNSRGSDEDNQFLMEKLLAGPQVDPFLTVRSVKFFADGALGSRGAWLMDEYSDAPGSRGQNLLPMEMLYTYTEEAAAAGFQVAVHAIGDRANKEVLEIYEKVFKKFPSRDFRFRIEHAQHISPEDIPRFQELGVIPSIQGIHMASDIGWAIDRLGSKRIEDSAYVWQKLLKSGAVVINGTDTPVEPIDPVANFYASVTRNTLKGESFDWSHREQAFSRLEALKASTTNAAYASFKEEELGTLEEGKLADLTIFTEDLLTVPEENILDVKVAYTIVDGEIVYQR